MGGTRAAILGAVLAAALALTASAGARAETTWLCEPGQQPNPCRESLATTVLDPGGGSRVETPPNARRPKVDCFYVYPTVSDQPTPNADLTVDPEQTAIAQNQAARFSRRCRVFAPLYRQLTLAALFSGLDDAELAAAGELAYGDVRAAWREYLREHSPGRGFVLIGHSQGTYMLRRLVADEIEPRRSLRRRLVSALLIGGNVTVEEGRRRGGDFERIPACSRPRQNRCVIGYSAFNQAPPADARFGIASTALGDAAGLPSGGDLEVLCTNPAALRGGRAPLGTLVRSEPFPGTLGLGIAIMYGLSPPTAPTPWVQPADRYTGACERSGGAHVLDVEAVGDSFELVPSPDPTWGIHLADVNIALGNLVDLVGSQARSYARRTR